MSADAVQVVERALELIAKPVRWTKGTLARNRNNDPVDAGDSSACRWCFVGACNRARIDLGKPDELDLEIRNARLAESARRSVESSADYNDATETTHADILDFGRCVIERLKAGGTN
jgi:hypothetical protein